MYALYIILERNDPEKLYGVASLPHVLITLAGGEFYQFRIKAVNQQEYNELKEIIKEMNYEQQFK